MLRLMYSDSFCAALGLTLNCSTIIGHAAPTINAKAEHQQHQADHRDAQIAQHQRREHRHRADQGDGHQDQLSRQHGIDVGVTGTGEQLAAPGVAEAVRSASQ